MEQLTKNQAVATSQEAVQNQNEPQLRDENAHNDKSVHGVLNPTYQAGLRRDAVQPDIEAEDRKSGSAGMPRPISYAVFCLKKKIVHLSAERSIGLTRREGPLGRRTRRQRTTKNRR